MGIVLVTDCLLVFGMSGIFYCGSMCLVVFLVCRDFYLFVSSVVNVGILFFVLILLLREP